MNNFPDIDSHYNLEDQKIDFFWQNGFVILKNVLSKDEISVYRNEIKKVAENRYNYKNKDFDGAFYQALNIRFDSKGVEKFCLSKRIGKIAADLMRTNAVRIFHEQAIFKEPGDTKSYWHQDQYFWPLNTNLHIGMWMALTDMTKDMGLMRFVKNSHTIGDLVGKSISTKSETHFDDVIKNNNLETIEINSMSAGDCSFHFGWTIHGAGLNKSNKVREAMVVTYYADGSRVGKLDTKDRKGDAELFLGNKKEGELANDPMNTIVYKK
jgi:ectoine hydroxylase-related dioxygenase (phytanoyl-CoA dioxygenase family)